MLAPRSKAAEAIRSVSRRSTASLPVMPRRVLQCLLNYRGQRSAYARDMFYRLAGRFTPMVLADTGPLAYVVPTGDAYLGSSLFTSGAFDADYLPRVLRLLNRLGIAPCTGKTFVDVGANIGTTTVPALAACGFSNAVAIEPEPRNFQLLRINLILNQLEERVRCLNMALSDSPGQAPMKRSHWNCGDHRVLVDRPTAAEDTIDVCLTTFDSLVRDGSLRLEEVGLVWMDTQGHEGHILSGASTLLASDIPVLTEFCPALLRQSGGLERFKRMVTDNYAGIVDIRTADPAKPVRLLPAHAIEQLARDYDSVDAGLDDRIFTDVLLLKRIMRA